MKRCTFALLMLTATLTLTGCGAADNAVDADEENVSKKVRDNTDPRKGWVMIADHENPLGTEVMKGCDGTTLMHVSNGTYSGGISVTPNSPECR